MRFKIHDFWIFGLHPSQKPGACWKEASAAGEDVQTQTWKLLWMSLGAAWLQEPIGANDIGPLLVSHTSVAVFYVVAKKAFASGTGRRFGNRA